MPRLILSILFLVMFNVELKPQGNSLDKVYNNKKFEFLGDHEDLTLYKKVNSNTYYFNTLQKLN
ncbi:MAG: hypothetical protein Q7W45_18605 [Bacteroidota bacterium]|nr:hypothetical protein [Bacteroidota bacterium]MDP3145654.1 hypothetical protein [Bacteroidota bacterium]